jgi:hypothetical protein
MGVEVTVLNLYKLEREEMKMAVHVVVTKGGKGTSMRHPLGHHHNLAFKVVFFVILKDHHHHQMNCLHETLSREFDII